MKKKKNGSLTFTGVAINNRDALRLGIETDNVAWRTVDPSMKQFAETEAEKYNGKITLDFHTNKPKYEAEELDMESSIEDASLYMSFYYQEGLQFTADLSQKYAVKMETCEIVTNQYERDVKRLFSRLDQMFDHPVWVNLRPILPELKNTDGGFKTIFKLPVIVSTSPFKPPAEFDGWIPLGTLSTNGISFNTNQLNRFPPALSSIWMHHAAPSSIISNTITQSEVMKIRYGIK